MPSGAERRAVPNRKLLMLGVPLIALVLVATLIHLLGGDDGPESAATLAASSSEPDAPGFASAPEAAPGSATPAELDGSSPAALAPQDVEPAAADADARDVRGLVLRASDASPVFWATVAAVQREPKGQETILVRAHSDANGLFALHSPHAIDGFTVSVPPPDAGRDDRRPARSVTVRVEWAGGDPNGQEVRLEVDTGWRLDLRLRDAAGQPLTGVSVRAPGFVATVSAISDAEGLCVLRDLTPDSSPLQLSVVLAPGEVAISRTVPAPAKGLLRSEATLVLP